MQPSLKSALVAFRHDLHAHPEIAFQEHRTAARVAQLLSEAGLPVVTGIGGTGLVATIAGKRPGPAIGLRADMDALPMEEGNTFAHRSTCSGFMHGCGHDGHTTILLGAALTLAAERDFAGTVHCIFQPAEEMGGGAVHMVDDGLFERFPCRMIFGLHNWPGLPAGHVAVQPGPMMAGMDRFDITVTGQGSHAAMPHQGTDTVAAAAQLITAIQTIVSRTLNPLDSAVVSVTQMHAGHTYNVLPEQAVLSGTCRFFHPPVQQTIHDRLEAICDGFSRSFGVRAELNYRRTYPPVHNHEREAAIAADAARQALGEQCVQTRFEPAMASEDFSVLLQHCPGAFLWLGNGPQSAPLHNPAYDFNDALIEPGVRLWQTVVQRALAAAAQTD